jgi:hypothetical protein
MVVGPDVTERDDIDYPRSRSLRCTNLAMAPVHQLHGMTACESTAGWHLRIRFRFAWYEKRLEEAQDKPRYQKRKTLKQEAVEFVEKLGNHQRNHKWDCLTLESDLNTEVLD